MTDLDELECVWHGKYFKDDNHLKELTREFLKKLESDLDTAESDINSCKDDLIRIQLIKKMFQWIPVPQYYFQRFQKSALMSSKLRERANSAYKDGNYISALRGYNLAVMFALMGDEELGLAYGNRSALFVQMKDPQLAIRDIQLALQCNYPETLKDKLLARQKKCNELIMRMEKDRDVQMRIINKLNGKKFCDDNVLRLKSHNASITNADACVTIDYTEEHGRRLIVNRNVSAGTVLVFEEPYVHILANYLTWDTTHCHFCSKKMLAGIPCTSCTFAIYCSNGCREKDVAGHFVEHNILSYHHAHETNMQEIISTRIIARAGPELLFSLFQRKTKLNTKQKTENSEMVINDVYFNPGRETIRGHNEYGVFDSGTYLPVYHLISHEKSTSLRENVSNVFRAIILTYLLRDHSNFFNVIENQYSEEYPQEQFEEFVGSLLLRHLENIPYNAVSISELQSEQQDLSANSLKLKNLKSISYGTAIFGLISLTNHSCDPNVVIAKKSEFQQTVLIAVRNINAGDEIFITYEPQFTSQITKNRQLFLSKRYRFNCQCHACVSNWSADSHLNYELPSAKCSNCSLTQKKPSRLCKHCDKNGMAFDHQLDTYQSKLYEADDLIDTGDYIQAIAVLQDCLKFFGMHFSSVFSLFQVAQNLYKRALLFLLYSYD